MVQTFGWADVYNTNAGVTGGSAGATVRVTNGTDLVTYAKSTSPYIIEVEGTVDIPVASLSGGMLSCQSNKTFIGIGENAKITTGGLYFLNKSNIIIQNITFRNQQEDCIAFQGTTGFFVTKCDLTGSADGLIDMNYGSDYGTISWCRFSDHSLTMLIGHSDTQTTDEGKLRITVHHNYFDGVEERQPRVRFGQVHTYNNYHRGANNPLYAIGVGAKAKIYSENNYFENIPVTYYLDNTSQVGYVKDTGSYFSNSTGTWRPSGVTWNPSTYYTYTADSAVNVKSIVLSGAGIIAATPPVVLGPPFALGNGFKFTDKNGVSRLLATIGLSGTTANRPTIDTYTGMPYFDTTLNKPIWRNASNNGWVDSTGTAV